MGPLDPIRDVPPPGTSPGLQRVLIVSPARRDEQLGNAVTANRWAGMLRDQGLEVEVELDLERGTAGVDLLIALHAARSARSIARFAAECPGVPIVVALTGTDLYRDLAVDPQARRSLELATRIVVLQEDALQALPARLRGRARVLHQSAEVVDVAPVPAPAGVFQVTSLAHLRPVKAPSVGWSALRSLPASSKVHWLHLGRALSPDLGRAARQEAASNPRYTWRGELPRSEALGLLAGSALHVLTSEIEGASSALSEAILLGVPALATRIPGNVGVLGADHPGLFPVGDGDALAALLRRAETDPSFAGELREATAGRAPLLQPRREYVAWHRLIDELGAPEAVAL